MGKITHALHTCSLSFPSHQGFWEIGFKRGLGFFSPLLQCSKCARIRVKLLVTHNPWLTSSFSRPSCFCCLSSSTGAHSLSIKVGSSHGNTWGVTLGRLHAWVAQLPHQARLSHPSHRNPLNGRVPHVSTLAAHSCCLRAHCHMGPCGQDFSSPFQRSTAPGGHGRCETFAAGPGLLGWTPGYK